MRVSSIAEVFGGLSGTGYVVGPDLILTASHVVIDGHEVSVRTLGTAGWVNADVVWRGPEGVDAALLRARVPLPSSAVDPLPRWGSAAMNEQISCRATGFPAVTVLPDEVRDSDTFVGQTVPGAGFKDARLVIQSAGGPRDTTGSDSPWAGMSGAAVFSYPDAYLLGIVEKVPSGYPNNRLKVLPTTTLLDDPNFRALVGDPAMHAVTKSGSVLHPPYAALPSSHPDSWLLEPRYGVVDFIDAGGQLDELIQWANSSEQFSIGVISGSGGMGKSRLASELADRLRHAGWDAGYLNTENSQAWEEISSERPLLIIVDYASRFDAPMSKLIERLAAGASAAPSRLILLERRIGAWWETVNRLTRRLAQHLLGKRVTLRENALSPQLVNQHVDTAINSLSQKLGVASVARSEIRIDGANGPLLIHIAVLLALRGTDSGPSTRNVLLQGLLDREVTRWEAALSIHKLGHLHPIQAIQLVAIASLLNPTRDEARGLLASIPDVCPPQDVPKAVEWLTDMLGTEDGVLRAIGPDLVVEHLLETLPDLNSLILRITAARDTITAVHRANLFHLLSLSAQTGRNSRIALTAALARHMPELLEAEVNGAEPQHMGLLSAALTAADGTSLALSRTAQRVAGTIPHDSERLAGLRAKVHEVAIVRARKRAGGRIGEIPIGLLADERARAFSELGLLLINLGVSLGHLSQWGRAAAATLEAVELYSVLGAKFNNFGDWHQLAIAFSHAGKFLRNLDMHDESIRFATTATKLWRKLAEDYPDQNGDLGISLTNLADALCSAGQPAAAIPHSVEAIALLRSEFQRGQRSVKGHLERALSELAHHRMEAGDFKRAWKALNEAVASKGLTLGEAAETENVEAVGFLNGLAAELHLREGNFDRAKACAILSANAYSDYAYQYRANFFYFRGSLSRLLRVLDASGDEAEAAAMRANLSHLLTEPDRAEYDRQITEFRAFQSVIDSV